MFFYTNRKRKQYIDVKALLDKLNLENRRIKKQNRLFVETFFNIYNYKNSQGHYFLSKHCNDHQLLSFLEDKFYVFAQSVSWYENKISFTITEDETFLSIRPDSYEGWTWTETEDRIRVVCSVQTYGFFDTSESEKYFNYIICYLGDSINKEEHELVDNAMLYKSLPKIDGKSGSQRFVVENPFGMKGFFEISWLVE